MLPSRGVAATQKRDRWRVTMRVSLVIAMISVPCVAAAADASLVGTWKLDSFQVLEEGQAAKENYGLIPRDT